MPRIRSIKPEFWTSEQVAACSRDARLLFVGMWNHCDDGGVHPASTKRLKMEVLPGDDITYAEIQRLVDELSSNGLIAEFTSQGQSYWYVTGWFRHQKIDRPSYRYPKYEDRDQDARRSFDECSSSVDPRSGREWKGMEGSGRESFAASQPEKGTPRKSSGTDPEGFAEFWSAYPARNGRKPGRKAAVEAYGKLAREDRALCLEAARNYARETQATDRFPKDAERFLKRDFWKDWLGAVALPQPQKRGGFGGVDPSAFPE